METSRSNGPRPALGARLSLLKLGLGGGARNSQRLNATLKRSLKFRQIAKKPGELLGPLFAVRHNERLSSQSPRDFGDNDYSSCRSHSSFSPTSLWIAA